MSKTKSIFITATGTDVGKTYVSGLLVKMMKDAGLNCGYYKPILSGAIKSSCGLIPGDCKHVIDKAHLSVKPDECLSYCFEEAVSPHLAASRAGIEIDKTKLIKDIKNFSKDYEYMVIEGAGGITCPIKITNNESYLMSDLIKDLGLSIIIVADGGLGTINSVLMTVEYAKNRNIDIKGIILNNYDKTNFMHQDNLNMIEHLTELKVLSTVEKDAAEIQMNKLDIDLIFETV